jgi:hypothetical protein
MTDAVIRDVLEQSLDELPDELRIVFVACAAGGVTPKRDCSAVRISHCSASDGTGVKVYLACALPIMGLISCR